MAVALAEVLAMCVPYMFQSRLPYQLMKRATGNAPQLPFAIAVGMALLGDGKQSIACLKPSDAVAYG